jgi:hypothetical protein
MKLINVVMMILLSIMLFACKSNPASNDNSTNNGIVGKWLWTETSGGIAGTTMKPSANQSVVIQFTADSNYYSFSHDTLQRSTTYSIIKGLTRDTLLWKDMPNYKQIIFYLTQDTLCIADVGADGFCSAYIRTN